MRSLLHQYARSSIVALTIALILTALPSPTFAAGPSVTVTGTGTSTCAPNARPVPSLVQGEWFDVGLKDFPIPAGGGVEITLTLPDGRIRGPADLAALPAVPTVVDYVDPTTPDFKAGPFINASFSYGSLSTWPTGCYLVTVTQAVVPGVKPAPPFLTASAQFMLLPLAHSAQSANLKLWVQAVGTSQSTGSQPAPGAPATLVNIFGQGVPVTATPPTVAIEILQPNGAIITLPPLLPFADGTFNVPGGYAFSNLHQPGIHTIYATVIVPIGANPATYTAQAQFNLKAATATPTNNATLEMLAPFTTLVPRGIPLSLQARKFAPGALNLALVLPNGVQIGGVVPVAADGNAPIALAPFGEGLPTGTYSLIATQTSPPFPIARTALIAWRLIPQQP